MRLGELLLQEKLVSPEGLEEALEAQVVHGGRLGTNLVELGLLSEKDLARALGKLHNVAFASGEMKPDPKALELVDASFADDKDMLPMRVEATRLTVVTINPQDIATFDEIAFRTGKRVVPVVIPEFRMNQLLRRHCKAFRPMRAIDVNAIRRKEVEPKVQDKGPELMSEEEFQSLYAQAMSGGAASPQASPSEEQVPEVSAAPPPPPRPVPAPAPTAAPAPPPPEVAASEPAPTPLSFAQAQQLLQSSSDREDVARTILRFAIGKWKRALLLSVQGPLVAGWRGAGQGVREKAVQRVGISLRGQSTFKLVVETRSHFLGPMKRDPGTAVFYKLLGGGFPTTAVLLPLLVRGKVVHILYVDDGPDQVTTPDVGELLILSQSVARSYEAMMKRRKVA